MLFLVTLNAILEFRVIKVVTTVTIFRIQNVIERNIQMTVKELIDKLKKEDPDRIVVMSKDSEGNSYSPLHSFWTGAYKAETTWRGEVGLEELTNEDIEQGYDEEDVLDGDKALIFSPIC